MSRGILVCRLVRHRFWDCCGIGSRILRKYFLRSFVYWMPYVPLYRACVRMRSYPHNDFLRESGAVSNFVCLRTPQQQLTLPPITVSTCFPFCTPPHSALIAGEYGFDFLLWWSAFLLRLITMVIFVIEFLMWLCRVCTVRYVRYAALHGVGPLPYVPTQCSTAEMHCRIQ